MYRLVHYRSTVIGILHTINRTTAIHPLSVFDKTEQLSGYSDQDTNWTTEESFLISNKDSKVLTCPRRAEQF